MKLRFLSAALLALLASASWPQASNSTVRGVVRDQTSAVVPGAAVTLTNTNANAGMRAYGMRMGTMVFVFDGTQHNEVWEGWSQQRPPGLDAVEEFKVEINNASAKFTRPASLVVSSRSGTNQFHGALFETNR